MADKSILDLISKRILQKLEKKIEKKSIQLEKLIAEKEIYLKGFHALKRDCIIKGTNND